MRLAQAAPQPFSFLKLLAHDIHWRILLALAKSDYQVNELVKIIKQPPNLIFYYLKCLRLKQLITERRSSADSRDIYYSLNLDQFRQMYFETGQVLHPALGTPNPQPDLGTNSSIDTTIRVLFLCTHNSPHSQMAEGLLRELGCNKVEVFSAGSEPKDGNLQACYVVLEANNHDLTVTFRRVNYDVERAAKAIEASDMPHEYAEMIPTGPG